ncbi:MAG: AraC family transcriptional regulator, partial [Ferruginibacter sp.]
NCIFGIKFKISPVIFNTKVNFGEYRGYVYPLSYLMEQAVTDQVKRAPSFTARVDLLNSYFQSIITEYAGSWESVRVVSSILQHCDQENDFTTPIEDMAAQYHISARTLHRYFETTTAFSSKKALQLLRIRKAVTQLAHSPYDFSYNKYGYYDHSHFYKHLKQFLRKETLENEQPYLKILEWLHKK